MAGTGRTNMLMLTIMAVASMQLQPSMAQTRHTVGDTNGWAVPSTTSAYSTWASSQTFIVGDSLAEVTRSAYDACNRTTTLWLTGNGPATVKLSAAGTRYFICTVGSHCSLGQKVAITVSAAATTPPASVPSSTLAPAQEPVSPPPAPAPGPATGGPETYIVGGTLGWTVPSDGAATYQRWASDKTFMAGDVLVFNFVSQAHNVVEVSRTAFDSCSTTSTISVISSSPASITLTGGSHYFICTFPQHCSAGQQLAINVTGSPTATPSSSIATQPSAPSAQSPDGVKPPPPPNSGSSVAALPAVLPLLSVALAFFY